MSVHAITCAMYALKHWNPISSGTHPKTPSCAGTTRLLPWADGLVQSPLCFPLSLLLMTLQLSGITGHAWGINRILMGHEAMKKDTQNISMSK